MSTPVDRTRARVQLHAGRIERAVLLSWQQAVMGASGISVRNLADALASGGVEAVEPIIRRAVDTATSRLREILPPLVRATMRQSAEMEFPRLGQNFTAAQDPDLGDPDDSGDLPIVSDLDLREIGFDAAGETIVEEQVEQLASELGESMTAGLLLLIGLGVVAGVSAYHLAQRIRLGLGLRPDQARAVANLARELAAANPGRLVTRFRPLPGVRTQPEFAVRVPFAGASAAWVEAQLALYIPMLLKSRAQLIGRTLSAAAWERGRALLWTLALRSGLLPPGTIRRWVTAGDARVCPRCRSMEGQLAVVGEPFVPPDVGSIPAPPLHAQCRCSAVLVRNRTLTSNATTNLTNRKDNLMSKAKQVFRRMTTAVVGEGADTAAWRAANERNAGEPCGCTGKSHKTKATAPATSNKFERGSALKHQERDRVLARLKSMTPAEERALYDKVRRDWLAGHAPPDSYAAALEALRNEYADDRPTMYTEVE